MPAPLSLHPLLLSPIPFPSLPSPVPTSSSLPFHLPTSLPLLPFPYLFLSASPSLPVLCPLLLPPPSPLPRLRPSGRAALSAAERARAQDLFLHITSPSRNSGPHSPVGAGLTPGGPQPTSPLVHPLGPNYDGTDVAHEVAKLSKIQAGVPGGGIGGGGSVGGSPGIGASSRFSLNPQELFGPGGAGGGHAGQGVPLARGVGAPDFGGALGGGFVGGGGMGAGALLDEGRLQVLEVAISMAQELSKADKVGVNVHATSTEQYCIAAEDVCQKRTVL